MQKENLYDTIIIGAGPAGLTAAIYLLRAGKKVLVLEKSTIGGGIASTPMIENYPGCISISGSQLADNMFEQMNQFGGELEVWEVKKIEELTEEEDDYMKSLWRVKTDGPNFYTRTIIVATGTKYRTLGLPNEENLIGHGISFCVTCDGAFYKGQKVAIVGGGNTAVTYALELSEICKEVIVIQNLSELTAEKVLTDKLLSKSNVEIVYNASVTKLIGDEELSAIKIVSGEDKEEREISVDGMFVSIGLIPSTDFLKDDVELNKFNYVDASEDCHTNLKGVFVAGDVRNKAHHQITTSTADGTVAALETIEFLKD